MCLILVGLMLVQSWFCVEFVNFTFFLWFLMWALSESSWASQQTCLDFWLVDQTTFWLVGMTIVSMFLAFNACFLGAKFKKVSMKILVLLLVLFVSVFFYSKTFLFMYIIFELSVIPIFLIVLGSGYQPERQSAGWALFLYTVSCSMPLLLAILLFATSMELNLILMESYLVNKSCSNINIFISLSLFLAFVVKLPTFLLHLWLPKAHVEAPAFGSMILASVLLKLGGAGITRMINLAVSESLVFLVLISFLGMAAISMLSCSIFDLKMIIAYSSVAHMALIVLMTFSSTKSGVQISTLIMVSHAFISSALFLGVTLVYSNSGSRSSIINKGILSSSPKLALLWATCCAASMATPPLISFFGEILGFLVMSNSMTGSYPLIVITILAAGAYSLILYSVAMHNENIKSFKVVNSDLELNLFLTLLHILMFIFSILMMNQFFCI